MERYAWSALIKEGKKDEYIFRHTHIWPEMKEELKKAGITNYSIWIKGNEVFGYYECEKGIKFASEYQASSPIVQKWEAHMKDIMEMEMDPITHTQPHLDEVFYLK
jgi:L-rhamnose mutarotase